MKKTRIVLLAMVLMACILSSCYSSRYLNATGVAYQTIRAKKTVTADKIPAKAKIIVHCSVDYDGWLDVIVENNTDKIMTVDRTKTFFQDGKGNSIPYYDPTVAVNTTSSTTGTTSSTTVNLGSQARALGIDGPVATALDGITKGKENSSSSTNTNTVYKIDQPKGEIPPHGRASLGRSFHITGVGRDFLGKVVSSASQDVNNSFTPEKTYASCSICVSYSINDGKTYETIITDIYANTLLVSKVWQKGKVNDALRRLYSQKGDALSEPWFLLHFESECKNHNAYYSLSNIINYK